MAQYADQKDYAARFPGEQTSDAILNRACEDIDAMTFHRIPKSGFGKLTAFQQNMVELAVCEQAHFCTSYGEFLNSPLTSYGINGVSMAFKEDAVKAYSGVQTTEKVHSLLIQSGLACPGV